MLEAMKAWGRYRRRVETRCMWRGCSLSKVRGRGRNIIGRSAAVDVPGQRGERVRVFFPVGPESQTQLHILSNGIVHPVVIRDGHYMVITCHKSILLLLPSKRGLQCTHACPWSSSLLTCLFLGPLKSYFGPDDGRCMSTAVGRWNSPGLHCRSLHRCVGHGWWSCTMVFRPALSSPVAFPALLLLLREGIQCEVYENVWSLTDRKEWIERTISYTFFKTYFIYFLHYT